MPQSRAWVVEERKDRGHVRVVIAMVVGGDRTETTEG
jgi:hypothetical protein